MSILSRYGIHCELSPPKWKWIMVQYTRMKSVITAICLLLASVPALAARDCGGMVEAIRTVMQDVCVSALAAIVLCAALTFVAEKGRRILSRFRSVTLAVWLCIAAASSVILGSDKTNGVLQAILPFGPQIQVVQLPQVQPVVPSSAPPLAAPSPRASADMPFRARAWNRRGAWNDSFRCAFPGEWVFPKSVKCKV